MPTDSIIFYFKIVNTVYQKKKKKKVNTAPPVTNIIRIYAAKYIEEGA